MKTIGMRRTKKPAMELRYRPALRFAVAVGTGWPYGGPSVRQEESAWKIMTVEIPVNTNQPRSAVELSEDIMAVFEQTERSLGKSSRCRSPAELSEIPSGAKPDSVLVFLSVPTGHTAKRAAVPVIFSGSRLEVNMNAGAGGWLKVEVLDGLSQPIPAFSGTNADELLGNSVRRTAMWSGNTDLSSLRGQPIQLRFIGRDVQIYAFQFPK